MRRLHSILTPSWLKYAPRIPSSTSSFRSPTCATAARPSSQHASPVSPAAARLVRHGPAPAHRARILLIAFRRLVHVLSSHSWREFFRCLCIKMQDDVKVPGDRDAAAAPLISTSEPTSTPRMSIPSS
ncbi:hypothetical protein C8F01DRAFT_1379360 [Mycena amicta]|nr:hypothetical protein C8F01DRAFT_1379360 [Mycena amicta]